MGAGKCRHFIRNHSTILTPQALIDVVGGRSNAAVSRPTHEGGRGEGWIQVGPGRASATQGVRLNGVPESDPSGQRRMQSSLWAAGQAICAVGRTLPKEWAATQQDG